MSREKKILCVVYGVLAVVGLIGTWTYNLRFGAELNAGPLETFLAFWPALYAGNHATTSITNDLLVVATVACIWMVVEGRRLGIRHAWAFVPFAILVAIAVSFPVFLIVRERALAKREAEGAEAVAPASG